MGKRDTILLDDDVLTAARDRMREAFARFDTIVVSFSGGKDSTICLEIALEVAEELGRLPLKVIHFDEEAIPYDTEHYVRRRFEDPRIDMDWWCLPVRHLNACSKERPLWRPWDPNEEDLWVRPLPPEALTWEDAMALGTGWPSPLETTRAETPSIPDSNPYLLPYELHGSVGLVLGVRSGESLARRRLIKATREVYIAPPDSTGTANVSKVYPVYDWSTDDVWRGIRQMGWDYNFAYDVMEAAGMSIHEQRCAPPYGAEPINGLWRFKVCWPDIWDPMSERVPGAPAAARYASTGLWNAALEPKPDDLTWPEFVAQQVAKHEDPEMQLEIAKRVRKEMTRHYKRTDEPILPSAPHPASGLTWKFLAMIASRGDTKGRKIAQTAVTEGQIARDRDLYDAEYEKLKLADDPLLKVSRRDRAGRKRDDNAVSVKRRATVRGDL